MEEELCATRPFYDARLPYPQIMSSEWWSRLRSWATGGMRQQVTRTGLWFTLALLVVGLGAFASANNLLFLILAAMLATFLVSGFISRLSLAGLELELLHPEHLCARRRISGRGDPAQREVLHAIVLDPRGRDAGERL